MSVVSERSTGVDRAAIGYILTDAGSTLVAFVGLSLVVRHLSVEDFGLADLLRTLQVWLIPLMSLNVFMGAVRFHFDTADAQRQRVILGYGLTVQCVAGALAGALVVASQPIAEHWISPRLTPAVMWFVGLGLPPVALTSALVQTAIAKRSLGRYVALTGGQAVLNLLAVLAFVVWGGGGLTGYLGGLLAAATVTAVGGFGLHAGDFKLSGRPESVAGYVKFGAPYAVGTAIQGGYLVALRLVLLRLASPQALAFYAVAERLQQPLVLAVSAAGRTWIPWLMQSGARREEGAATLARALNGLVLIVLSGMVLFLPELIALVGGVRYSDAYLPALLLLLANWIYFVGDWIVSADLFVSKRSHHVIWVCLVAYGSATAVAVSLVPWLGSTGAALSSVSASVMVLAGMALVRRTRWAVRLELGRLLATSSLGITVMVAAGEWAPLVLKPLVFAAQVVLLVALTPLGAALPFRAGRPDTPASRA